MLQKIVTSLTQYRQVNGSASGSDYFPTEDRGSSCNSKVHSIPSYRRLSQLDSLSVLLGRNLLILITALYYENVKTLYSIALICQVKVR